MKIGQRFLSLVKILKLNYDVTYIIRWKQSAIGSRGLLCLWQFLSSYLRLINWCTKNGLKLRKEIVKRFLLSICQGQNSHGKIPRTASWSIHCNGKWYILTFDLPGFFTREQPKRLCGNIIGICALFDTLMVLWMAHGHAIRSLLTFCILSRDGKSFWHKMPFPYIF